METTINDGDALRLEDGKLVQVKAAAEKLLEVRAENPLRLMRLAWHLGSQHGLAEFTGDALYIENSPALAELARGQGCTVTPGGAPLQAGAQRPPLRPRPWSHHHGHAHRHRSTPHASCSHDHEHDQRTT